MASFEHEVIDERAARQECLCANAGMSRHEVVGLNGGNERLQTTDEEIFTNDRAISSQPSLR